jgi:hypothetical protein
MLAGSIFLVILFFITAIAITGACAVIISIVRKRLPKAYEAIAWFFLPFVSTALCCYLPLSTPLLVNNYQLSKFASNLYDYPLPPRTQVIGRFEEVGLTGNSNHCDFLAQQTMLTSLSQQEIEEYYADVLFPPVRSGKQSFHDSYSSRIHPPVRPHLEFWEVWNKGQLKFNLSLFDHGYPAGLDYRCH